MMCEIIDVESTCPKLAYASKYDARSKYFPDIPNAFHMTDTEDESIQMDRLASSDTGMAYLNLYALPDIIPMRNVPTWRLYSNRLRDVPTRDQGGYCIASSFVMCLYGLREARDLDYLTLEGIPILPNTPFDNANAHYAAHAMPSFERLARFFVTRDVQVLALPVVAELKHQRGERKDFVDNTLIGTTRSSVQFLAPGQKIKET